MHESETPTHRQGNGVRVHVVYFTLVSLVALVLIIAAIVVAAPMM